MAMQEPTQEQPTSDGLRTMVAGILDVDVDEVMPEASFYADLGMDSLQKTAIVVALEQEFGLVLAPEEAVAAQSVADLLRLTGGER
jgi:acyl carrier protein